LLESFNDFNFIVMQNAEMQAR